MRELLWNLAVFWMIFNITALFVYLTSLAWNYYLYRQNTKNVSDRVDHEGW